MSEKRRYLHREVRCPEFGNTEICRRCRKKKRCGAGEYSENMMKRGDANDE